MARTRSKRIDDRRRGRRFARASTVNRRRAKPLWRRISLTRLVAAIAPLARRTVPGWIALAIVGAVSTGLYFAHDWLTSSPRFAVAEIDLSGTDVVATDELTAALATVRGVNIFTSDIHGLADRIESHPWIAAAQVKRQLPNRLVVDLEEHVAVAVVELDGLYLVDINYDVFKRVAVDRGEGKGLPVVTGIARSTYLNQPELAKKQLAEAIELAELYSSNSERPALGEVHLDDRTGFTLRTYDNGAAIRVGRGGADLLSSRLSLFDATWTALDEGERAQASTIFTDNDSRTNSATVAFVASR